MIREFIVFAALVMQNSRRAYHGGEPHGVRLWSLQPDFNC